jgi:sialic acid synthase SpsE
MSVMIIGEIASAHDGDYVKAVRLIDAVADAGADICKIQFFKDPDLMAERRRVPDHYRDIYRRYSVPPEWAPKLSAHAHGCGLQFACTVFVPGAARYVSEYCDWLKVASFENGDMELLSEVLAETKANGTRMIVSFGMEDANAALDTMCGINGYNDVVTLHCVSCYPCLLRNANLRAIFPPDHDHWDFFDCNSSAGSQLTVWDLTRCRAFDGFSDHVVDPEHPTHGILSGALAVAYGATVLEKHVRLDDTDPQNPDYAPALTPAQFAEYVRLARLADAAGGDGVKRCLPCEQKMAQYRVR